MLIKTLKDGRQVEVRDGQMYLDGTPHTSAIIPIPAAMRDRARALMPEAEYVAGTILLSRAQGEAAMREIDNVHRARRAAEQEKLEQAIPGLEILRTAYEAEEEYREAFERMMEDEHNDGARPPRRPATNSTEIATQYPRAAAYLKAEAYSRAAHHAKAGAGRKAMTRLIAGGTIEEAEHILANWVPAEAVWD